LFNKKAQFGFIRVIFIALCFLFIFGALSGVINDSTETFQTTWGDDEPFLSWFIGGVPFFIWIGFILFVVVGLVWGLST